MGEPIRFVDIDCPIDLLNPVPSASTNEHEQNDVANNVHVDEVAEAVAKRQETPVESDFICPYSASHLVSPKLFHEHLLACRREYMTQNQAALILKRCKYNGRHFVPDVELEFHEHTCNDEVFKKILAGTVSKPEKWVIPEKHVTMKNILEEQDVVARLTAREIVVRSGAERDGDSDVSEGEGEES